MKQSESMKTLTVFTVGALVLGTGTVVLTLVTWPTWDPAQAAASMATILEIPVDPSELTEPNRVVNFLWLAAGVSMVLVGLAAAITSLHAAAVRDALSQILEAGRA